MTVLFNDGFDYYGGKIPNKKGKLSGNGVKNKIAYRYLLPVRSWWERLRNPKRPAGTLFVSLQFGPSKGDGVVEWKTAEAKVEYPEGIDEIKLEIDTWVNGKPFYFSGHPQFLIEQKE